MATLMFFMYLHSVSASAGTFNSSGTYSGTINGVAYNFFSGTGVGLTGGATCNGQQVVILLNSNPQFKDMLAILLAAQTSGSSVRMFGVANTTQSYGNGLYTYCVITALSLGDFPLW